MGAWKRVSWSLKQTESIELYSEEYGWSSIAMRMYLTKKRYKKQEKRKKKTCFGKGR